MCPLNTGRGACKALFSEGRGYAWPCDLFGPVTDVIHATGVGLRVRAA